MCKLVWEYLHNVLSLRKYILPNMDCLGRELDSSFSDVKQLEASMTLSAFSDPSLHYSSTYFSVVGPEFDR